MNTSQNNIYLCRDCGQPMDAQQQIRPPSPELMILVTCWNRNCSLWSVTLSTTQYKRTTDERWAEYRESVATLKTRFSKES